MVLSKEACLGKGTFPGKSDDIIVKLLVFFVDEARKVDRPSLGKDVIAWPNRVTHFYSNDFIP